MIDMDLQGGPFWNVPTGRRDGVISKASDVFLTLPAPFHNLTTLLTLFGNVGLDATDLVLLSGIPNSKHKFSSFIIIRFYQ
jgi:peroxidase